MFTGMVFINYQYNIYTLTTNLAKFSKCSVSLLLMGSVRYM